MLPRTPLAVPQPGQAGWPHCLARLRLAMLSSPCSPVSAASVASVAARVVARVAVRVARVTRVVARVAARVAVRLAVREAVAKESEGGGGEAGGEHMGWATGEERRGRGVGWAIERGLRSRGRLATLVGRHTELHLPAQHNVEAPVVDALGAAEAWWRDCSEIGEPAWPGCGARGSQPLTLTLIPTLKRTLPRFVLHVDLSDTAHDCTMKCAAKHVPHTRHGHHLALAPALALAQALALAPVSPSYMWT